MGRRPSTLILGLCAVVALLSVAEGGKKCLQNPGVKANFCVDYRDHAVVADKVVQLHWKTREAHLPGDDYALRLFRQIHYSKLKTSRCYNALRKFFCSQVLNVCDHHAASVEPVPACRHVCVDLVAGCGAEVAREASTLLPSHDGSKYKQCLDCIESDGIYNPWRSGSAHCSTLAAVTKAPSENVDTWIKDETGCDTVRCSGPNWKESGQCVGGTNWAVLVSGATGWEDYWLQVGVYRLYWRLIQQGFPDENIIVMARDDLRNHKKAPDSWKAGHGSVYYSDELSKPSAPTGNNKIGRGDVRYGMKIDYSGDDVTVSKLQNIFDGTGEHTLQTLPADNVFFYISSHGSRTGGISFPTTGFGILSDDLSPSTFQTMLSRYHDQKRMRKMLVTINSCFAEKMLAGHKGFDRVAPNNQILSNLYVMAAASKQYGALSAERKWTPDLRKRMSTEFEKQFMSYMMENWDNPEKTLEDMYTYVHSRTKAMREQQQKRGTKVVQHRPGLIGTTTVRVAIQDTEPQDMGDLSMAHNTPLSEIFAFPTTTVRRPVRRTINKLKIGIRRKLTEWKKSVKDTDRAYMDLVKCIEGCLKQMVDIVKWAEGNSDDIAAEFDGLLSACETDEYPPFAAAHKKADALKDTLGKDIIGLEEAPEDLLPFTAIMEKVETTTLQHHIGHVESVDDAIAKFRKSSMRDIDVRKVWFMVLMEGDQFDYVANSLAFIQAFRLYRPELVPLAFEGKVVKAKPAHYSELAGPNWADGSILQASPASK